MLLEAFHEVVDRFPAELSRQASRLPEVLTSLENPVFETVKSDIQIRLSLESNQDRVWVLDMARGRGILDFPELRARGKFQA